MTVEQLEQNYDRGSGRHEDIAETSMPRDARATLTRWKNN